MLSPDNARVLFSLGLVFTNKGQYDRGIEFLERAIQLRPYLAPPTTIWAWRISGPDVITTPWSPLEGPFRSGNYQTAGNLARIYWLTGRKDEARQNIRVRP